MPCCSPTLLLTFLLLQHRTVPGRFRVMSFGGGCVGRPWGSSAALTGPTRGKPQELERKEELKQGATSGSTHAPARRGGGASNGQWTCGLRGATAAVTIPREHVGSVASEGVGQVPEGVRKGLANGETKFKRASALRHVLSRPPVQSQIRQVSAVGPQEGDGRSGGRVHAHCLTFGECCSA